jgi:excinuclease UvrABC nuclease subunit
VVPSEATGIYRYKDKTGQIIYIGRGNIKNRLAEPERKEWNIETVEYSEITDQKDQITWEKYWLDDFKNNSNGKLPYNNKTP